LLRATQSWKLPKIHPRLPAFARAPAVASAQRSDSLTAQMQEIIAQADTTIASANMDHTLPSHQIGVDIPSRRQVRLCAGE
jgi:hypothetical protein